MNTSELLQAGLRAFNAGDLNLAQSLFAQLVKADPNSEEGWLWLGQAQTLPDRRAYCFRRVLALNPNNAAAQRFLEKGDRLSTLPPAQSTAALTSQPPKVAARPLPPASVIPPATLTSASSPVIPLRAEAPLPPSSPAEVVSPPVPPLTRILVAFVGFLLGIIICGTPFGYWILSGRFDRLTQAAFISPTSIPQASVAQPTPLTSSTEAPTPTPLLPEVTATAVLAFSQRLEAVQEDIVQAHSLMDSGEYAEAVTAWTALLAQVPEYADGYYQRSQGYIELTSNQRFESEYLDYMNQALADLNQAIALDSDVGEYYFTRYRVDYALGSSQFYRVDQDFWYNRGLEDLQQANRLGIIGGPLERDVAFVLLDVGRCDEALAEMNRLLEATTNPDAGFATGLAYGYRCQGKYEEALTQIETALEMTPSFNRQMARAIILYNLGRLDDALDQINATIEDSPYYCGCRYYLRALIYYDQGKPDLAQADLDYGSGQTWDRGGILPYVLGRLALDAGNEEEGIALLQEAEASLSWDYHGPILKRIQQDLAQLKATLLSPTLSVPPTSTPLPITPQAQPPTLTPFPLSHPANVLATPVPYAGTEAFTLNPEDEPIFDFYPPVPWSAQSVDSVSFYLEGGPEGEDSPIELYLWSPTTNRWDPVLLPWGPVDLTNGPEYVTYTGHLYTFLSHIGDQAVDIENLRVVVTITDVNGESTEYP